MRKKILIHLFDSDGSFLWRFEWNSFVGSGIKILKLSEVEKLGEDADVHIETHEAS